MNKDFEVKRDRREREMEERDEVGRYDGAREMEMDGLGVLRRAYWSFLRTKEVVVVVVVAAAAVEWE